MMCDFSHCMTTLEQTKAELEALEERLAAKQKLLGVPVRLRRSVLRALDESGGLDDDALSADWRATFARFLEWAEPEQGWVEREQAPEHPPDTVHKQEPAKSQGKEAALDAASALLCTGVSEVASSGRCLWTRRREQPSTASTRG